MALSWGLAGALNQGSDVWLSMGRLLWLGARLGVLAFGLRHLEVCLPIVVDRLWVSETGLIRAAVDLCLSRLGNPMGQWVLLGLGVPTHNFTFRSWLLSILYI